jgi:dTDP-glucose pyrophosphorylase
MNRNIDIYFITKKSSIRDSILKIRKNGTRTLLVVKKNRYLLGTITEGDIQNALIDNVNLDSNIEKIFNKNPKKVNFHNYDINQLYKIFIERQYGIIPAVDSNNIVKKIITWEDIFNPQKSNSQLKNIEVVIMAGGKGERLKPYTTVLPKPLIPINNKPMLEHIIDNFKYFNFNKFHLVLNHQANLIKSYFKSNNKNFNICYVKEPKFLGTVGGIRYIKKIKSDNFLLANCDTLFKIDYIKFYDYHKKNKNFITLVTSKIRHEFSYGFCKVELNKLISIKEKPKLDFVANTGLYIIKKEIIKLVPKNKKFDVIDLIKKCLFLKKKIGVYEIPFNSWTDLGQLSDFNKAYKNY